MGYINEDGTVYRGDSQPEKPKEGPGCFGLIFSFLMPIVGVILYFTKKDEIENASYYLWAAGISFVIGMIISSQ